MHKNNKRGEGVNWQNYSQNQALDQCGLKGSMAKGWHHSFWDQRAAALTKASYPWGSIKTPERIHLFGQVCICICVSWSRQERYRRNMFQEGFASHWNSYGEIFWAYINFKVSPFPLSGWSRTKTIWRLPQWLDCVTVVSSDVRPVKGEKQGKYLHASLKSPVEIQSHLVLWLKPKQRKFQDVNITPWEGYNEDRDL